MFVGIDYGVRKLSVAALISSEGEVRAASEVYSYFGGHRNNRDQCFTFTWGRKDDRDEILKETLEIIETTICGLWVDATRVCIEYPFMMRNAQTAIRMSMMAGTLMAGASAYMPEETVTFVEPAKWKRDVVGYARADKQQTMEFLATEYPQLRFENDDEADAWCLALHGYLQYERESSSAEN